MTTIYLQNLSELLIDNSGSIITSSAAESPGFQSCTVQVSSVSEHNLSA